MDTCGFPKDNYFYYKTWWAGEPALHVFPHWTWPGREGEEIDVWCYSNQQSVELFLNGSSLGSQAVEKNGHLSWKVKYVPGKLEARASANGQVVLTAANETASEATRLVLTADRVYIQADGEDLSVVTVKIVDAKDRPVPVAANKVSFELQGPGRILGVGNGDPTCYEPDRPESAGKASRSAFNGLCMVLVQSSLEAGQMIVAAQSAELEGATVTIATLPSIARAGVDAAS
jgi:beta-galactosidase